MTKKEVFCHLVGLLDRKNIRYALVGNTEEYPDHIGSDVDIVTDADGLETFHRSVWSLETCGIRVIQCFQHEISAFYYILGFENDSGGWDFLQPDICTDYYRRAIKLLDAVTMLETARQKPCTGCPGGSFCVLSAPDEFIYYLLKKIGKGKPLSAEQFEHLQAVFAEAPDDCRERARAFGSAALYAAASVDSGEIDRFNAVLPGLKRDILRSGVLPRPRRLRDALRKLCRVVRPTGFVVVLSGEDAHARASSLHASVFNAFRRHADFSSLNPGLFRKLAKAKIASTLAVLDGMPRGFARMLVDADLSEKSDTASAVLALLAARARSRRKVKRS